ncbi:hypothetical protein PA6_003_01360 [Aquipseudomonas alcaligenes NBRC 14159]|uniref:Uncharacterized protein n=1 Tax=Aquipseudomonas alcaligenes (strain ATCC 14909 / DSM 50342 / CCUG 1425 / JCM 20561 / NBRC 14159 / NCIMB 9945 / NCTC 10367 / 1577) TaxID=1215092 RepID=U2ZIZ4_AQUA1|nr:hypothetical protein PA6_003_01360 [Pseudomonas alcaligenes NBRC 14159]
MICAPWAAAARTSFSALAILAALSQEQAIWVAATVTIRDMEHLAGAGQVIGPLAVPLERRMLDLYPINIGFKS